MEKKIIGIRIFGIIYLLSGIMFIYATFGAIYLFNIMGYKIYLLSSVSFPLAGLILLLSAFLLFKLKSIGCKLAPIGLFLTLPSDGFRYIAIVLLIAHFYYFTRPKVKEQFR